MDLEKNKKLSLSSPIINVNLKKSTGPQKKSDTIGSFTPIEVKLKKTEAAQKKEIAADNLLEFNLKKTENTLKKKETN